MLPARWTAWKKEFPGLGILERLEWFQPESVETLQVKRADLALLDCVGYKHSLLRRTKVTYFAVQASGTAVQGKWPSLKRRTPFNLLRSSTWRKVHVAGESVRDLILRTGNPSYIVCASLLYDPDTGAIPLQVEIFKAPKGMALWEFVEREADIASKMVKEEIAKQTTD